MDWDNELLDDGDANLKNHRWMALIGWWERGRLYYNLSLVAAFVLAIFTNWHNAGNMGWTNLFVWLLFYVLLANICYTIGWAMEFLRVYYGGAKESFVVRNKLWFWFVGTVLSGIHLYQKIETYLENWAPSVLFEF